MLHHSEEKVITQLVPDQLPHQLQVQECILVSRSHADHYFSFYIWMGTIRSGLVCIAEFRHLGGVLPSQAMWHIRVLKIKRLKINKGTFFRLVNSSDQHRGVWTTSICEQYPWALHVKVVWLCDTKCIYDMLHLLCIHSWVPVDLSVVVQPQWYLFGDDSSRHIHAYFISNNW